MATPEQMAVHDKDAWQALDMADIRKQIHERSQQTGDSPIPDDGISFVPLAARRIWACGHYYTLMETCMNASDPIPDSVLATRACQNCTVTRALHWMAEEEEDEHLSKYEDV